MAILTRGYVSQQPRHQLPPARSHSTRWTRRKHLPSPTQFTNTGQKFTAPFDRPIVFVNQPRNTKQSGFSHSHYGFCCISALARRSRVRLLHRLLVSPGLTRASVIFNDPDKAPKLFPVPVMQCLQVKQMAPSAQGGDRYRLVMSDGGHYVQTMLATQANRHVHDGKLVRGCFVRVKQYTPNNLKGKK